MQTTAQPNSTPITNAKAISHPWLMHISRSVLFILFQALVALILFTIGTTSAWSESARWWTFTAFLTNFVSIYFLVHLYNAEGKGYLEVIHFSPET